jgi:hypothetical protein
MEQVLQLVVVFFAALATSPQPITARTIISRPLGVKGAFLWVSIRSSANH